MICLQIESSSPVRYTVVGLALLPLILGCNGGQGTTGTSVNASQTAPTRITITAKGTTFKSAVPAVLRIIVGLDQIELSFGGVSEADPSRAWSAVAWLTVDQVQARLGTIAVTNTLTGAGATIQSTGPASAASSGSIQLSLDRGHISGSAAVLPDPLAASFVGDMVVGCWVPRSSLPGATDGGGTVDSDGGEALVADDAFVTSQCAPFASLAK
jgi:hypothetical protein